MRLALDPCLLDASSVYNFHMSVLALIFVGAWVSVASYSHGFSPSVQVSTDPSIFACAGLSSAIVSARKSASTCPFIALLGVYLMPIMLPMRFKKKSVGKIVEKRVAKAIGKYEKTRADSNNAGGSGSTNNR
ncbi:hypothetical protein Tco_0940616 [Tanacetum coccineum]|uniref:Uncharacterized protein n=1 Tax=Tanacetum coccineum TaxID=301880 RepID=A0ABQ5DNH6_9ASTR